MDEDEADFPKVKQTGPKTGGPSEAPETEDGAQDSVEDGVLFQADEEKFLNPVEPTYSGEEEPSNPEDDDDDEEGDL